MRILQVGFRDTAGGAAKVAWNLSQIYRAQGHDSWLAVGHKHSDDPSVLLIPNHEIRGKWYRFWQSVQSRLESLNKQGVRGTWRLSRLAYALAAPRRWLDEYRGIEDFHFPGTWHLLKLTPAPPDIIHCHNLHGWYFDLWAIPWLSQQVPLILTLHDPWLLTGHCSHSFGCERWETGCGRCPDLTIYPAIRRDATAYNWRRKKEIYAQSRLYVATPSKWLMGWVEQSMLFPAIIEARVIPNGVDLSIFHPRDRRAVREALGVPQRHRVLLFTADTIRRNSAKDYRTMRTAVGLVAEQLQAQHVLFIGLGEDGPAETIGRAEIRFVPYQKDPETVARYYQAADIYIHAARVDTFPNTVLEALACGTPVVATAVGGIPEQVKSLWSPTSGIAWDAYAVNEATGLLVPQGDAEGMAKSIECLLTDEGLRLRLGENAARDARERFDLHRQARDYLEWYSGRVRLG